MHLRRSSTTLSLLVTVAGLGLLALPHRFTAAAQLPVRPAQGARIGTPEPPLADAPPPRLLSPAPPQKGSRDGEPIDPPVPVVAIKVRVAATAAPGQELEYRLLVENTSRAAAHHVLVRNPLPANARFVRANPEPSAREPELQWRLGTLEGCTRREIVLVLAPTGTGDVENCARVQFEHGQCVRTRLGQAELKLRKTGPARALVGDVKTFVLELTNAGATPATDVELVDSLPPGLEHYTSTPAARGKNLLRWQVGTLPPGRSLRFEYRAFVTRAGVLENVAAVTAAGGQRQVASSKITVSETKLTLALTGPARRGVSRVTTYELTVTNPGTTSATEVRVVAELPPDLDLVAAGDGGRREGSRVVWSLGTLGPGVRRTVRLEARSRKAGELVLQAHASADRGPTATAEARTLFEGAAGLTFEIDKTAGTLEVGREATYTIRVLNQGNAEATRVGLTVAVPAELQILSAKGTTKPQQDRQVINFDPLERLKPGEEASYEVAVKALKPGDVRVRAEITADQLAAGPVRQEEGMTIFAAEPPSGDKGKP
jgi:uncharacterized repeat protein (TIGR01451 family)